MAQVTSPAALNALRDLHMPASISNWQLAPGWYLLAFIILILTPFAWFWFYPRWRRFWLKRRALQELAQLQQQQQSLAQLSMLMRRVCLALFPKHNCQQLTGDAWLAFLDRGVKQPLFSQGAGRNLIEWPYQASTPATSHELFGLCQRWIKTVKHV